MPRPRGPCAAVLSNTPLLNSAHVTYHEILRTSCTQTKMKFSQKYNIDNVILSGRIVNVIKNSGASPSGKAAGFGPAIRRFESFRPSHLKDRLYRSFCINSQKPDLHCLCNEVSGLSSSDGIISGNRLCERV